MTRNTRKYKSLPYDPALRDKAKALRKAGILHEALLWRQLKSKKLNGLDFDRQKIIGHYIVDFYCAEKAVVIEVDGSSHDSKQADDAERDGYLQGLGLSVIRLLAKDVLQNMEGVVMFLENHPTLTGTPPEEGNKNIVTGTAQEEGNENIVTGAAQEEGNENIVTGATPEEGNENIVMGATPEEGNENIVMGAAEDGHKSCLRGVCLEGNSPALLDSVANAYVKKEVDD
jgi:very-short-patch-repair endonuclease